MISNHFFCHFLFYHSPRILSAAINVPQETRASSVVKNAVNVVLLKIVISLSSISVTSSCLVVNSAINRKSSSTACGYCVGCGVIFLNAHCRF